MLEAILILGSLSVIARYHWRQGQLDAVVADTLRMQRELW